MPLFWRVFVPNAVVLIVAGAILSLSPASVPAPSSLSEVLVLVSGLGAMLILNLALMRAAFYPLERLTSLMRAVDPLHPGRRIPVTRQVPEVVELTESFNEMLDRLETERREYARRSLAAEEEQRRNLARELHDEIGQTLTALMLQLGSASRTASGEARERILEATDTGRQILDDLHRVVRQLRPEALDDLGLPSALATLSDRLGELSGVRVDLAVDRKLPPISPEEELVVYRVAQESLTNIVRHAGSSSAHVTLRADPESLTLTVRDHGRGFGEALVAGSGIRGMQERALLVGADLELASPPEGGAEVQLTLPLNSDR